MKQCSKCKRRFDNIYDYVKHQQIECKVRTCPKCQEVFSKGSSLRRHIECDHCDRTFCNESHFQRHLRGIRKETDNTIPDLDQQLYPRSGYENKLGYLRVLLQKNNEIQDRTKKTRNYTIYNKEIDYNYTYRDLNEQLLAIYKAQRNSFKVNLGLGFILHHTETKEYKYYYVSSNNMLFDYAVTITNKENINNLIKHIISLDLATDLYLKKPTSGWVLGGITNIQFLVFPMKNIPI